MFPRWMSLLVLAFLAYMLMTGTRTTPVSSPVSEPIVPTIEAKTYPALAAATDVERWKRAVNPDYAARMHCTLDAADDSQVLNLKIMEDKPGTGDAAGCSETITVQLTVWNAKGAVAYQGELALTLGTQAVAAGIDVGLIGLKTGGTRTLILPPALLKYMAKTTAPKPLLAALKAEQVAIVTATRLN